jgi:hypothetical protein
LSEKGGGDIAQVQGLGFNLQCCKINNFLKEERGRRLRKSNWLTPIILDTQEAEIRRITVQSQAGQIVRETLSQKNPSQTKVSGVARGVGSEFKTQYRKKKSSCPERCPYI